MKDRLFRYILMILMISSTGSVFSQDLKSRRVGFKAKPSSSIKAATFLDQTPPVISIINPVLYQGNYFKCSVSELDLVGEVADESGLRYLSINSDIKEVNQEGIFSSRIKLERGINKVRLVAMDKNDNVEERVLILDYSPPSMSLADQINSTSTYYALIIAIDTYQDNTLPNLDNPIEEARRLREVLTSNYTFAESNIIFLEDATRADIIESLDKLSNEVTSNDNLLIYYAGHGWWEPDAKNGYWLPSDAETSVKTNWFRNSALVDYLSEIESKHTLLIADACFGGSIFKTRAPMIRNDKGYESLYNLPSRKAMTSGNLTNVPDKSAFAQFLIKRLIENEEEYLTSGELFISFKIAVINNTNSNVVPQYGEISNVGDEGGDFIFLKKKYKSQTDGTSDQKNTY
jgi:Caspase domain/Glucodextranase, domain B